MYSNKTIIITGASSGIGKAIATEFLEKGANIVINARNEKKLEEFVSQNVQHKSRIHIKAGDIALKTTGQALAKAALERFGSIDVLVNNAGTFIPKPFLEATEEDLDMYVSTALKGSYFTSQAVIPSMVEQAEGCIINIGSMWVEHPIEATPSSASQVAKGGVHTLTRHLAIEFASSNIRVNTIAPAIIDTPLYDNLMDHEQLEKLASLHPLRKLGTMKDITSWVLHLAGEGGRFVTGQTLFVDGGITAGAHVSWAVVLIIPQFDDDVMRDIKQILEDYGIILPQAPMPVGNYQATIEVGNLMFISGQLLELPTKSGHLRYAHCA